LLAWRDKFLLLTYKYFIPSNQMFRAGVWMLSKLIGSSSLRMFKPTEGLMPGGSGSITWSATKPGWLWGPVVYGAVFDDNRLVVIILGFFDTPTRRIVQLKLYNIIGCKLAFCTMFCFDQGNNLAVKVLGQKHGRAKGIHGIPVTTKTG
jgi:hypothetical protein